MGNSSNKWAASLQASPEGVMKYHYKETVDWGIIKREWIGDDPEYVIVLEQHEEDRFTVKITHRRHDLEYYSYWAASGKLTFDSLEQAQAFAADRLARLKKGDYRFCTGAFIHTSGEQVPNTKE
jgi:hypothetical protein